MFTGLIEAIGTVSAVDPSPAGIRIRIDTTLANELTPGDSLAVNGVCLTVVTAGGDDVEMDVSPQTGRVTTLGTVAAGTVVNLERSLRAGARLGGHFVQGHVDATGTIETLKPRGGLSLAGGPIPVVSRSIHRTERVDCGRRDQPDGRRPGQRAIQRANHPVHLGAHESAPPRGRLRRQSGVRYPREVRRPRDRRAAGGARRSESVRGGRSRSVISRGAQPR